MTPFSGINACIAGVMKRGFAFATRVMRKKHCYSFFESYGTSNVRTPCVYVRHVISLYDQTSRDEMIRYKRAGIYFDSSSPFSVTRNGMYILPQARNYPNAL